MPKEWSKIKKNVESGRDFTASKRADTLSTFIFIILYFLLCAAPFALCQRPQFASFPLIDTASGRLTSLQIYIRTHVHLYLWYIASLHAYACVENWIIFYIAMKKVVKSRDYYTPPHFLFINSFLHLQYRLHLISAAWLYNAWQYNISHFDFNYAFCLRAYLFESKAKKRPLIYQKLWLVF